jgi:hypothetical protein
VANRKGFLNLTIMASPIQEVDDAYMEDSFVIEQPRLKKTTSTVVIDEQHPFDLDAYISNYERASCLLPSASLLNHIDNTLQMIVQL